MAMSEPGLRSTTLARPGKTINNVWALIDMRAQQQGGAGCSDRKYTILIIRMTYLKFNIQRVINSIYSANSIYISGIFLGALQTVQGHWQSRRKYLAQYEL